MKALFASTLIPPEWIAAHGLEPVRLDAEPSPAAPPAGACPYAWCWMQTALARLDAACLIFTTECDMMRRLAESAAARTKRPVFLFNMPKTTGPQADAIYRSELERLGRFLVRCGGHAPTGHGIAEAIRIFAEARRTAKARATFGKSGLLLVGGPLMAQHGEIEALIERAGGTIVLDATETGELAIMPDPDPDLIDRDPVGLLVAMYGRGIPSVHRRPNAALYEWLAPRLTALAVRGILFVYYPWCDAWHAEARRMAEWAGLPLLPIVLSADSPPNGHLAGRIEAFLEALR